jgi:tight adherence protein C
VNQLLGLLLLTGAVPLLWLALRRKPEADPEPAADADADQPVWADAARPSDTSQAVDLHDVVLQVKALPRLVETVLDGFGRRVQRVAPGSIAAGLERSINLCGMQGRMSVTTLLTVKFLTTVAGIALGFYCFTAFGGFLRWLLGIGFCAMGFFTVNLVLSSRASKRQQFIQNRLPDVLDQISVCVEAGLGFDAAMLRAAKTAGGPLGEELGRTIQDIRLGASRSVALNALVERSAVPEVRLFARALIQAEKTGVPMARVLRVQSEDARERRRQLAEEKAMKLPVKMLGPLMLCILPALFIVILGPAIMSMMDSGLTGG